MRKDAIEEIDGVHVVSEPNTMVHLCAFYSREKISERLEIKPFSLREYLSDVYTMREFTCRDQLSQQTELSGITFRRVSTDSDVNSRSKSRNLFLLVSAKLNSCYDTRDVRLSL